MEQNRLRNNIEKDFEKALQNCEHLTVPFARILFEILLDIRDSLDKIEKNIGVNKWGTKL